MDPDRARAYLLTLPHVAETMQWGANLVFWAGDKTLGGKMFALMNLDEPTTAELSGRKPRPVISYAATPTHYAELLERDGLIPAPYFARAHWVAVLRWDVFAPPEWKSELAAAHERVFARLPVRTRTLLELPAAQRRKAIAQGRTLRSAEAARRKPR